MRLNPAKFNQFLVGVGQRMLWRQSFICPCITDHSGAADPACKLCRGRGRVWNSPLEGWAGVSQQQVNPQFQDFGQMELGDMTLTVPNDSPLYAMGRFDRVTLLNSTDVFSRVMTRGVNDNLADLAVQSVDRVFWRSPAGDAIVEGATPAVDQDGVFAWPDSGAPDPGVQFSITGIKYDDYFVYQALPSDRNAHMGAPLPKRVQLRKWDLMGR